MCLVPQQLQQTYANKCSLSFQRVHQIKNRYPGSFRGTVLSFADRGGVALHCLPILANELGWRVRTAVEVIKWKEAWP